MRIVLDADPVGRDGSGNETFLRGLISGLHDVLGADDQLVLVGRNEDALREVAGARPAVVGIARGLAGELTAGRLAARAGAEVFVAHYNPPVLFPGPVATVVHDVSFRRHPEAFPRLLRARIEATVWRAVRVSDLIVTGSEFSRTELLDLYPKVPPARVAVTPYAVRASFADPCAPAGLTEVRHRYGLPERFVLAVGNLQPRKNLARLSQATAALAIPLVVVGQPLWRTEEVRRSIRPGQITWLGHVSDDDLRHLYALCTVFAYPSLYEGFGLPILEAMAAGAPVVTSAVSAMPEVAGDAAVLVDPFSVDDIEEGIGGLVRSAALREDYAARGRARAQQFSWQQTAAVLVERLRGLVRPGRASRRLPGGRPGPG